MEQQDADNLSLDQTGTDQVEVDTKPKYRVIDIGGIDVPLREFTNEQRLALSAFQKSKQVLEGRERVSAAQNSLNRVPVHPVQQRVNNQLSEENKRWEKYLTSLLPKEIIVKHAKQISEFAKGDNPSDQQLGEVLAQQSVEKEAYWAGHLPQKERDAHDIKVYKIQKQVMSFKDEIDESEEHRDKYTNKLNVLKGDLWKYNRDFVYFLFKYFDGNAAKDDLSAEDQVRNFFDTKDQNKGYSEYLDTLDNEKPVLGAENKPITSWVSKVSQFFMLGQMSRDIQNQEDGAGQAQMSRAERRKEKAITKKAGKNNPPQTIIKDIKETPSTQEIT